MEDSGMARRMRDKAFRDDQWARRYTGRVERINRFIDELGAKDDAGHPPYIPPVCGGVDALALSISRDPGPKAGGTKGSGFLSIENDDPSAERMGQFLDEAGIDYAEHGLAAGKGWRLFLRENLGLIERRGIVWLSTYHTSRQALQTPDRVERGLRDASIRNALVLAAAVMRAPSWPAGNSRQPSRRTEPEAG